MKLAVFDHCLMHITVIYMEKNLILNYVSCARAAMLHDFFLYDWKKTR